jgi:hypothetical protein
MKILSNLAGDYQDGYNTSLRMEEFSDDDGITAFFYGIQCGIDRNLLKLHENYKRKILLDLWSPCAFFTEPNHFSLLEGFDEVYSICPYTCDWTNRKLGRALMKYRYYPVSPDYVESASKDGAQTGLGIRLMKLLSGREQRTSASDGISKEFDVCYVGGVYSPEHKSMIDIISRFNYVFVTQSNAEKATHRYLSNAAKLNLVRRSKIGICFNKLYPTPGHLASIRTYDGWQSNRAFSNISDTIPTAPQIKTRLHELALCKTLILCQRDPWNVVEDYYEPGKEFIYFENVDDLNTLIPEIAKNLDSYQHIISNAYLKARSFSTANLVKMVQEGGELKRVGN